MSSPTDICVSQPDSFKASGIARAAAVAVTTLAVSLGIVLFVDQGASGAAPHPPGEVIEIVGLGDSYSAGVGISPVEEGCDRHQELTHVGHVARRVAEHPERRGSRVDYQLAACSGAVTGYGQSNTVQIANSLDGSKRPLSIRNQIEDFITEDTDVVTLTAGGNDLGFADLLVDCYILSCGDDFMNLEPSASLPAGDVDWDGLYARLVALYRETRLAMNPEGHLYVFTYPAAFSLIGNECEGLSYEEQLAANAFVTRLGDTIWLAAQEANERHSNIQVVDWRQGERISNGYRTPDGRTFDTYDSGNGLCGPLDDMINGFLVPVLDIVESGDIGRSLQAKDSFHPTLFGYQFAANRLFEAVEAQLIGNLPAPAPAPTVPDRQRIAEPRQPSEVDRLQVGEGLRRGESLVDQRERGFRAVMQQDGNFVIYDCTNSAIWATNTAGSDMQSVRLQSDGRLVGLNEFGDIRWRSGEVEEVRNFGFTATLSEGGNLLVFSFVVVWSSDNPSALDRCPSPQVPTAPTNPTCRTLEDGRIHFEWEPSTSTSAAPILSYITSFSLVPGTVTSAVLDLPPGEHRLGVSAKTQAGTGPSSEVITCTAGTGDAMASPTIPSPPTNVNCSHSGQVANAFVVSWGQQAPEAGLISTVQIQTVWLAESNWVDLGDLDFVLLGSELEGFRIPLRSQDARGVSVTSLTNSCPAFETAVETSGPVPSVGTCNGLEVTVDLGAGNKPTDGDDVILGTEGSDRISAGAGRDVICGLGGDDVINAGQGADIVFGGGGDDVINAGQGRDIVDAGAGNDFVSGGKGKDTISGAAGDDDLRGNEGTDRIVGGAGDDLLRGGQKADSMSGGNGADTLVGGTRPDVLDGGSGLDEYDGGAGQDTCVVDPVNRSETRRSCEL